MKRATVQTDSNISTLEVPTSEDGEDLRAEASNAELPEYSYSASSASVTLNSTPSAAFVSSAEGLQSCPPAYCDTMELPTYDECIRAKLIEEAEMLETPDVVNSQHIVDISLESRQKFENVVGTDAMFILGFILSFLFNWIGLLTAFCLMHTCAGRFGALTGFGLSLVKWVTIAKRNNWMVGMSEENVWVWWLLLSFGILISCSGILQYLRLKYLWSHAHQGSDNSIQRLM